MSKVYKALEKAEREREVKQRVYSIPKPETTRIEEEVMHKPSGFGEMISDQQLVSVFQPGSLASEQFRKLRTTLLRSRNSEPPRTIMVTSATSGEGKSFVSANLAAGIASDLHNHALLVECDLRDPTLSELFGLRDAKGLSDYLAGNEKIPELLMKTGVEKLVFFPGGSIQGNPTELIGSKKMEALVHELKSRYSDRYLILDSTPLLATSESEVLSKLVDAVIIVVRAGATPRETVKQALSFIDKGKILGFVLNDVQFKSSGLFSRYFGSDGYYYRYGYAKKKFEVKSRWKIFGKKGS